MLKKSPDIVKNLLIYLIAAALLMSIISLGFLWYLGRAPRIGGDFTLNYQGHPWKLSEHAKKINVLYIGYAQCPDVCPLSLSIASQAFRQLTPEELKDVQLIFISVDYQHDKPDQVATYAAQFFPDFVGTTGTQTQIDQTVKQFKASYMYEPNSKSYLGYSIAHTDRLFILNKKGYIIDTIPSPRDYKTVLEKIKENL